ncbi:MAG: ABC transporter ATP-binding protein [Desulfurococcales archaeon]|nr:ABC transporter ATP-binding protein [Desulfurococcales archaeon]
MNASSQSEAVKIDSVTKKFGRTVALDNIHFSIRHRSVHALLGHNGAGKTTTIRLVAGLLKPDQGSVSVFGHDPYRNPGVKSLIGYAGEYEGLYNSLSVRMNLQRFCNLKIGDKQRCIDEVERVSSSFELHDILDKKASELSAGNRQRVVLARAFIGSPRLILLDEPLNKLDPVWRRRIKDLLKRYVELEDATILYSTHILSDVEELSENVTILRRGRLVYHGSLNELLSTSEKIVIKIRGDIKVLHLINQEFKDKVTSIVEKDNYLMLNFENMDDAYGLLAYIIRNKLEVKQLELKRTTLEDIYIEYYLEGVDNESEKYN